MADFQSASLLVEGGLEDGTSIAIGNGVTWIGRAPENDIVVEDPGVSRQHAGIRQDTVGYWIKDMGSRNGTFINGNRVRGEGQRLNHMDRIELGGLEEVQWVFQETGSFVSIPE